MDQEAGHLGAGDGSVGAVAGWVGGAAEGDVAVGELLGVADPPLAVGDVGEAGFPHSWGVAAEDADEPDGHGRSLDGLVGTEQPFAAFGVDEQAVGG